MNRKEINKKEMKKGSAYPSSSKAENIILLNVVSKETRRIVEELTKELIYEYRISNPNDSIISEWRFLNNIFEKRGESVVKINPQYNTGDVDLGLFDFTANIIQNVLSTRNLDLVINALDSKKFSEITLENGKTISNKDYQIREIGFKMNHHIIEKYMNEAHKLYGPAVEGEKELFIPTTLEYEQKCGFEDGSNAVYIGYEGESYSVYHYIGIIMTYLFFHPLISTWIDVFEKEYILKQLCSQK